MRAYSLILASVLIASPVMAHNMSLSLDNSQVIRLSRPASGVVIGNASIADVAVHDPKVLLVTGKSIGTTHLLVIGEDGRTLYSGQVSVRDNPASGSLTVMKGREIETFQCVERCYPNNSAESTTTPLNDANNRIRTRAAGTYGSGARN